MENSIDRTTIPGANPENIELPSARRDSLSEVGQNGNNPSEEDHGHKEENGFESLAAERNLAEYAKGQIIYSGLFINPDEVYSFFPPNLAHKIRDPHVTVAYRPGVEKVFLDSLSSEAIIRVVGYGNNGENEGLLVEVSAEDPVIQKTLSDRVAPDRDGKLKTVPMHITLSIADGAEAVNTKYLDFTPIKDPINLTGTYKLFGNDGTLIPDKNTIKKMRENGFTAEEVEDPDRL